MLRHTHRGGESRLGGGLSSRASFLPLHLSASLIHHGHESHRFDSRLAVSELPDLRAIDAHLRITLRALEQARTKFLIQFTTTLVIAIAALAHYIYLLALTSGGLLGDGFDESLLLPAPPPPLADLSLLVFGCCSIILLVYIASGTWVDRMQGREKYVQSCNRWLSLFAIQWQATPEGDKLVAEPLPKETPHLTHSRRSGRHSGRSLEVPLASGTEGRRRSMGDPAFLKQAKLATAIAASLAAGTGSAPAVHTPAKQGTPEPDAVPDETPVSFAFVLVDQGPPEPVEAALSEQPFEMRLSDELTVVTSMAEAVEPISTSPRVSRPPSRPQSRTHSRTHSPTQHLQLPLGETMRDPTPLTPSDASFLQSSMFSPDLGERSSEQDLIARSAPPTQANATDEDHPPTEMERLVVAIQRSQSKQMLAHAEQQEQPPPQQVAAAV